VSISTASLVNHQSQLRVPPMPRTAALPSWSASGKSRSELTSAVVLPEPGAPMKMYQGSWYRYCRSNTAKRLAGLPSAPCPKRMFFRIAVASVKPLCSSLISGASSGLASFSFFEGVRSWLSSCALSRCSRHLR